MQGKEKDLATQRSERNDFIYLDSWSEKLNLKSSRRAHLWEAQRSKNFKHLTLLSESCLWEHYKLSSNILLKRGNTVNKLKETLSP